MYNFGISKSEKMFKHHRYPKIVILQAVYFKLRFTLSYRDVEELLHIRGVEVDHSTIQCWVYKFSPEIEKNMRKGKYRVGDSWRMDETYIKVGGKDRFLYRAVDKVDIPAIVATQFQFSLTSHFHVKKRAIHECSE